MNTKLELGYTFSGTSPVSISTPSFLRVQYMLVVVSPLGLLLGQVISELVSLLHICTLTLLSPDVDPVAYLICLGSLTGISNYVLNGTLDFKCSASTHLMKLSNWHLHVSGCLSQKPGDHPCLLPLLHLLQAVHSAHSVSKKCLTCVHSTATTQRQGTITSGLG